ncbi:MAG: hypothetical protein WDW38_005428 [Sanguina aurantia]
MSSGTVGHTSDMQQSERRQHAEAATTRLRSCAVDRRPSGTARMRGTGPASAVLRKALVCISLPQDPTGDARVVSAATPPEMVAPPSNLAPRSHEPSCSGLGINDIATRPQSARKAGHRVGVTPRHDDKGGHGWSRPDVRKEVNHQALGTRGHPSQAGLPQPSRRIPLTSAATKWHCVTHGCVLHDAAPQAVLRKALVCISLPQDPTGDARVVSAATPPEMVAPPSNLAPRSHEPSCSGTVTADAPPLSLPLRYRAIDDPSKRLLGCPPGTVGHTSDMQQSERRQHAEAATHASAVVRCRPQA